MRLLFDTHAFLWFVNDSPELTEPVREMLEDTANDLYLSIASVWEMAIKTSLGKLQLPEPVSIFIMAQLQTNNLILMPIEIAHLGRFQEKGFHHEGHKEHEERKKTQTALIVTLRVLRFFVVLFS